ncbi:glycosyltransferase family 4 protein [Thermodesulfobacteriota bacterium]
MTWYAHSVINPIMMGALFLSNVIITASPDSFRIRSRKIHVTGHGIDTDHYSRKDFKSNRLFTIGSVGRISRIKNYEILLRSVKVLVDEGVDSFTVKLYGNIQTEDDKSYMRHLEDQVAKFGLEDKVSFPGPITGDEVPEIMSSFGVFINLLSKGGAGKAVLEAMSVEVPTLICTHAFNHSLSRDDTKVLVFQPNDIMDLKNKIKYLMHISGDERRRIGKRLRRIVIQEHSLQNLASKIDEFFKNMNKCKGV